MKKNSSITSIVLAGLFAAIIAVVSQISIPLPTGVPITLQTFIVPLCGFVLGWKLGLLSISTYLLIGLFGAPVFANFSGGVGALFGKTGGFLIGFLFLTLLSGFSILYKNKVFAILIALGGLFISHLLGILQFSFLMKMPFLPAAWIVTVPYLLKDTLSVIAAYFVAIVIRKSLSAANLSVT